MTKNIIFIFILSIINYNVTANQNNSHNNSIYELRKKLHELETRKTHKEIELKNFKNDHAWSSRVKYGISQLYTPITGRGGYYGQACDVLLMPWEAARIFAAYILFPITIPVITIYETKEWNDKQEFVNKEIKTYEDLLLSIQNKTKKTQQIINDLENTFNMKTQTASNH